MSYPPNFDRLLADGKRYPQEHDDIVIQRRELATCAFPTGRVVGCDPFTNPERAPFTATFDAGEYQLVAWLANISDDDYIVASQVAALELVIRHETTATWELAILPSQDPKILEGDEIFGYPVDAGAGTLADPTTLEPMKTLDDHDFATIFNSPEEYPNIVVHTFDEIGTIAVVDSGYGDGAYPTFIGRGHDGEINRFITDFLILPTDPP